MDSKGVYLAFNPAKEDAEQVSRLEIFLINYSAYSLLFAYDFYLNDTSVAKLKNRISPQSILLLNEMEAEKLNDFPVARFEFWDEQANHHYLEKTLNIKAKSFFTKKQIAPLLNREAFVFPLFAEFPKEEMKAVESEKIFSPKTKIPVAKSEIIRQANFETEIDLHIEKLISDHKGMSNAEIIKIQLLRFRQFLEKAIVLGVPKIYVIHGKGKGRLREEIYLLLPDYPEVQSFNNDYHVKYEFGATEIILENY